MEVILQENVSNLGFVGDIIKVKPGYARNFLFPKRLAVPANKSSIAEFEHKKKVIEVKKARKKVEADEIKKRLESVVLAIQHAAGEGDKLFGSVTIPEILEKLSESGFILDRKLIRLETPIRTLGEHTIEVRLHQEVSAVVKVTIEAKPA